MAKKGYKKKKSTGSTSQQSTTSSGTTRVTTRTKLSDYKFNVGEARNASEFNQICTYLYQYIKSSKDWSNDIYLALKNDGHLDLDKDKPRLVTTQKLVLMHDCPWIEF